MYEATVAISYFVATCSNDEEAPFWVSRYAVFEFAHTALIGRGGRESTILWLVRMGILRIMQYDRLWGRTVYTSLFIPNRYLNQDYEKPMNLYR
jgi:hypothetical protein